MGDPTKSPETTPEKSVGVRHHQEQIAFAPISKVIEYLRLEGGYTIKEIVSLSDTPEDTLKAWSRGRYAPSEARRRSFFESMQEAPPSRRHQREMQRLHGLTWDKGKRKWKLRLTLDMGKKVVGRRVNITLRTADREVAIQKRDGIVEGYRRLGLTVRGKALPRKAPSPR